MFQETDVITRTEYGARACNDPALASELPRKLRTILLAIDNETPLSLYRRYLRSFGDIDALFQCLYEENLITVAGRKSQHAAEPLPDELPAALPSAVRKTQAPSGASPGQEPAVSGLDTHQFEEMMSRILSEVEKRLGADGLDLMMALESLESFHELQQRMPDLQKVAKEISSGQKAYKLIEKIMREAA